MGTAQRRLEILKHLCRVRKTTYGELAKRYEVSIRTVQRDISELEQTFRVPLDVRSGKRDGGIYVIGGYRFDHAYMHADELALLSKIQRLSREHLTDTENALLSHIIDTYSLLT